MRIFRMFWFKYLGSHFRWYRKWYGGRWELHYIGICHADIWLDMHPDRCWPKYRQPCSYGTPITEQYETNETNKG